MMKALKKMDRPRDLFIVTEILEDGHLRIRKSEKQWRKNTYRVKPEQLLKVFDSGFQQEIVQSHDVMTESTPEPNQEHRPTKQGRAAKSRANMTIKQQAKAGMTVIKHKEKQSDQNPSYIEITWIQIPIPSISWTDDPFPPLTDFENDDKQSMTETTSSTLKQTQSIVDTSMETSTLTMSSPTSMVTMTETDRAILNYQFLDESDSQSSLAWDDTASNLEPLLNQRTLFPEEEEEETYEDAIDANVAMDMCEDHPNDNQSVPSPDISNSSDEAYVPLETDEQTSDRTSPVKTRSKSTPDVRIGSSSSSVDLQENQFHRNIQLRRPVTPRPSSRNLVIPTQEDEDQEQTDAANQHQ